MNEYSLSWLYNSLAVKMRAVSGVGFLSAGQDGALKNQPARGCAMKSDDLLRPLWNALRWEQPRSLRALMNDLGLEPDQETAFCLAVQRLRKLGLPVVSSGFGLFKSRSGEALAFSAKRLKQLGDNEGCQQLLDRLYQTHLSEDRFEEIADDIFG